MEIFVDDTYCLARAEYLDNILLGLNHFHKNIKFTFEIEKDKIIPFLDILRLKLQCIGKRHIDLHMSWYSFSPKIWKWGTLKTLVQRAHINCSTEK